LKTNSALVNLNEDIELINESNVRLKTQLRVNPKKVAVALTVLMLFLLLFHLASVWSLHYDSTSKLFIHINQYFDLNREKNFPTYFSSAILMMASLLLLFIYKLNDKPASNKRNWLFLAAIFLFLSLDEAIEIHEQLNIILLKFNKNDFSGYLKWIWVAPYVLLFAAVAFYNLRFLLRLPKGTRNNFMLSGFVYVFAAAGIESLEGHLTKTIKGKRELVLFFTTIFQEVLEMAAIILFIYGLLRYIATIFPTVELVTRKN